MTISPPIKLGLVDDHPTLVAGLAAILQSDDRFEVIGTGGSAQDALTIVEAHRPDVMVLDLSMPGEVFESIRQMTQASEAPKVLIFTAFASVELALRALDAGARAFVLKGGPVQDLYEAILAVRREDIFVTSMLSQQLVAAMRRRNEETSRKVSFSEREQQLIDGLLLGRTNKEIALALDLSEKTVKHYMTSLMSKLGVKNRVEVVLAVRNLDAPAGLEVTAPQALIG